MDKPERDGTRYADLKASLLPAILLLACLLPGLSKAQPVERELLVAVGHCPPFVVAEQGKLSGLGIFLWEQVALEMGASFTLAELPLGKMLHAIADQTAMRRADVGISCLSITADRERVIDFSHSFHETYTAIAVRERGMWETVVSMLTSTTVLRAMALVALCAALVGGLLYALEHRVNEKLYSMNSRAGRWTEAFIVGLLFITRGPIKYYEFKTPVARVFSSALAVGSTFLIAGITALLASAFTLESLRSQVTGLQDLRNVRVAALSDSTSSAFLEANGVAHIRGEDLDLLMAELDQDRLDAVVADAAFLKYSIKLGREGGRYQSLSVLPYEFDSQNYGFALQQDSPLLEAVNQAMLTVRKTPEWRSKLLQTLGE